MMLASQMKQCNDSSSRSSSNGFRCYGGRCPSSPLLHLSSHDLPRHRRITRISRRHASQEEDQRIKALKNLNRGLPAAQHWARLSHPLDSGVSVRCEGRTDHSLNFYRLDKYGQRRLLNNITQAVRKTIHNLRCIHKKSILQVYFVTWRVKMEYDIRFTYTNQFRYRAKPAALLRSVFLAWKYQVACFVQGAKCQRMGIISLYSMLYHMRRKKLHKYFLKWGRWSQGCVRLTQKALDYWVIFTYKAKLLRCNALKFMKHLSSMSNEHTYRKRKSRKQYFFHVWRQKTIQCHDFSIKKEIFTRWCQYKSIVMNRAAAVKRNGKFHLQQLAWKVWRISMLMLNLWSKQSERLRNQYFRRWKRDCRTRLEVGNLLYHCIAHLEAEKDVKIENSNTDTTYQQERDRSASNNDVESVSFCHDDADVDKNLVISDCDTTSLERNKQEDDEQNIDHLQKQLFCEESCDQENLKSFALRNSKTAEDLAHLKIRVSATHDYIEQYEARQRERQKLKTPGNRTRISGRQNRNRNSKNFDSDYS